MKKLHSFALYAVVTPAIALSSGAVLAQQPNGQDAHSEQQSTQAEQAAKQHDQSAQGARKPDSQATADSRNTGEQSRMHKRGYLESTPANGAQASDLIGAEVKTTSDEDVGLVQDLIIDQNGQVVAIVVGVGGFLGIGQKNVAIGWDSVTRSEGSDEPELGSKKTPLRIDVNREDLQFAPEFEGQD